MKHIAITLKIWFCLLCCSTIFTSNSLALKIRNVTTNASYLDRIIPPEKPNTILSQLGAVTGLVGLFVWPIFLGIIAIAAGIIGLKISRKTNTKAKIFSIAAIVLGSISVLLGLLLLI
jgi:hypothetical protein